MEKYLSEEERKLNEARHKQELQVLKAELSSVKPGRAIYSDRLGCSENSAGHVFFKVTDHTKLKSDVEKELHRTD